MRRVCAKIVAVEEQYYRWWVCVCLALGTQHAMRMRHTVISGLPGSTVFFHIISQTAWFSKKKLLNTKCVFWLSVQLLTETFVILRLKSEIWSKMYICLHVKCPVFPVIIFIIGIQPLGRFGQRPELSQATGIALVHCILGKFLGVVCHCFPPVIF